MKSIAFKIIIFLMVSGSIVAQKKEEKKQHKDLAYESTKRFIQNGDYIFDCQWVSSAGMKGSIDVIKGLVVENGELFMNLPYFGSTRSPTYFPDGNSSIAFRGIPEEYNVKYIAKKRRSIIKMKLANSGEHLNVTLTVGSTGQTNMVVVSSDRNTISYKGILRPITVADRN